MDLRRGIVRLEFRNTPQSETAPPLLDRGRSCRIREFARSAGGVCEPTGAQSKETTACGQPDLAERGVSRICRKRAPR